MIYKGKYINLQPEKYSLKITLKKMGESKLKTLLNKLDNGKIRWNDVLRTLIYDITQKYHWSFVLPEEIGALTDSPILAYKFNDRNLNDETEIFWYPEYQVSNEYQVLLETKELILTRS